jgi:hypothetical protein
MLFSAEFTACDSSADISPFFQGALDKCRLFVDDQNRLGIVPAEADIGDVVCALVTAIKLCVLRARSDRGWVLVCGECYMPRLSFLPNHVLDLEELAQETFVGGASMKIGAVESFEIW